MRQCGRDHLWQRLAFVTNGLTKGIVVGGCLALLVATSGGVVSAAPAAPAKPLRSLTPCMINWGSDVNWGNNVTTQTIGESSCLGAPPDAITNIDNCGTYSQAVFNTDAWLTQLPQPGGTRLAESGRTGYIAYPNDCAWYNAATVNGWGQYGTSPLWACGWYLYQRTGTAHDYVCVSTGN